MKSPSCELLPEAVVLDQAFKRYSEVMQTLPALGARIVGGELEEMKVTRQHVEDCKKWRDVCVLMCARGKKDEMRKKW